VTSSTESGITLARRVLPFLKWWPSVNAATLKADAFAGLVGAIVVLPQGVAFAALAGMPPEYGLYCAMVPAIVAALFGSSLHAMSGPTNAVSLVVFAALSPLAVPGTPHYIELALTLALMSGVLMIAMGALGFGSLFRFMSNTVVVGFTAAIGVLIFASQLGNFLGIGNLPASGFTGIVFGTLERLGDARPWVVVVAAGTLAIGILSRRFAPRLPAMLTATMLGGLLAVGLSEWLGAERTGLRFLGVLPRGLPPLSMPDLSPDSIRSLLGSAVAVSMVALMQAISITRAIALKSGQRLDVNQESVGQGLANISAAFFSGFPTSASVNRCGVNYEAGARTPLSSVFSAVLLVVVLLAVAPLAAYLPIAVVAGVLFLVAWGLIDVGRIRAILAAGRSERVVLGVTFVATLLLDLEFAILIGIAASLGMYLNRTSHPVMRSLVPDPRHSQRKMTEVEDGLLECPQLKILRIEGSIYFGAADHVKRHFETLRERSPGQKHLLLMSKSINFVDMAGAEVLVDEARRRRADGGGLYFYSLRKPVETVFERGGYIAEIGRDNMFRGKREAIGGIFGKLDRSICARCRARIFEECSALPEPKDA
jgi:SulP family sulfate permease